MAHQKLVLTLDKEIIIKINHKFKKEGYRNAQQYVYELIRRDLFRKKAGGRPKILPSEETYLNKFSSPTKKSRKIEKQISERI